MPIADIALADFTARHHGLIRRQDAHELGLSNRQLAYRVTTGMLDRIGLDVFRVTAAPRTRSQSILAGAWQCDGVASHRTAAEVQRLRPPGRVNEYTVRRSAGHEHAGLVVHRSSDLVDGDVTLVDGIPTTTVTRTLVDLGAVVRTATLELVVHDALHRRLTSLEDLHATYRRISRQGRSGAAAIRAVLDQLDPAWAGRVESPLELRLLRIIIDRGLPAPTLQHRVVVHGQEFRLDMAYPEVKAFIEGDGFGVHGARSAFESDRDRQNALVVAGWTPLRFTWRQARDEPEQVFIQIRGLLIRLGHPDLRA